MRQDAQMVKYIAIDQYNTYIPIEKHPRKELMDYFGARHADKMCIDSKSGKTFHVGYIVRGHWCRVVGIEGVVFSKEV